MCIQVGHLNLFWRNLFRIFIAPFLACWVAAQVNPVKCLSSAEVWEQSKKCAHKYNDCQGWMSICCRHTVGPNKMLHELFCRLRGGHFKHATQVFLYVQIVENYFPNSSGTFHQPSLKHNWVLPWRERVRMQKIFINYLKI